MCHEGVAFVEQYHRTSQTKRQSFHRNSRLPQPRKLKRVIIREELVALTGDYKKALLLHQLEYHQSQAYDIDRYLIEESERMMREGGGEEPHLTLQPSCGWFQRSAKQLSEETFLRISDSSILAHLQYFIEQGWLEERPNPKQKWDRKKQYRLGLLKLKADLEEIGYQLEGWALDSLSASNSTFSLSENASSKTENGVSEIENRVSETEDRVSKTEEQYINTVSEHKTKHTTEHTTAPPPRADNLRPPSPAKAVGVNSKFTFDECQKFAEHLQKTGQGITNPGGYATIIHRSGEADALVLKFLDLQQKPEVNQTNFSECSDCRGTGYWYPAGVPKGVAKCKHARLCAGTATRCMSAHTLPVES